MNILLTSSFSRWKKLKELLNFHFEKGDDDLAEYLINFWEKYNSIHDDVEYDKDAENKKNVERDETIATDDEDVCDGEEIAEESVDLPDDYEGEISINVQDGNKQLKKVKNIIAGSKQVCRYCGKILKNKSSLTQHEHRHDNSAPYNCLQCGKGFFSRFHMEQHNASHTALKSFVCSLCGKSFQTKLGLQRHEEKERGEYRFKCDVCLKPFVSRNLMLVHSSTHAKIASIKCGVCGVGFKHPYHLKRHLRLHDSEAGQFACAFCDKRFSQKRYLTEHHQTHQTVTETCSICDKIFKSIKTLNAHRKKLHRIN